MPEEIVEEGPEGWAEVLVGVKEGGSGDSIESDTRLTLFAVSIIMPMSDLVVEPHRDIARFLVVIGVGLLRLVSL